jgi:hypothetical protein
MAIQLQPQERDLARFNQAIRELVDGRHNATDRVTLTPNAATTVVTHPNCSKDCEPQLSPRTLHAAQEVGNGTMYVSAVDNGSFTITHANNAQNDRVFGFTVTGG